MDSLDLVEAVMLVEEVFGTEIPITNAETFGTPREMVDWLELHLLNQRPDKAAVALRRKLAKAHKGPELAEAWKVYGDENKSPLSFAKSSHRRGFRYFLTFWGYNGERSFHSW